MNDRKPSTLPFESGEEGEQQLWAALEDLPRGEPGPGLRRDFYLGLEHAQTTRWPARLKSWLGLDNNHGWATAAVCLIIGFGVAQLVSPGAEDETSRLEALELNLALLNRELIMDRLQDDRAATRLQGVMDASAVVSNDPEVARQLLVRASQDRSQSVRSAAIDVLGPQMSSDDVGSELMQLLRQADSPLVQYALVDLVLRNGTGEQIQQLGALAEQGSLHPDLVLHVNRSLGRESI